jgi:hypothetical protein
LLRLWAGGREASEWRQAVGKHNVFIQQFVPMPRRAMAGPKDASPDPQAPLLSTHQSKFQQVFYNPAIDAIAYDYKIPYKYK